MKHTQPARKPLTLRHETIRRLTTTGLRIVRGGVPSQDTVSDNCTMVNANNCPSVDLPTFDCQSGECA